MEWELSVLVSGWTGSSLIFILIPGNCHPPYTHPCLVLDPFFESDTKNTHHNKHWKSTSTPFAKWVVTFWFGFPTQKIIRSILWPLSGMQSPKRESRRELDSPHPVCFGFICSINGFVAVVLINDLWNKRMDAAPQPAGPGRRKSMNLKSLLQF